jgi:probable phosphoglycerate mutase
MTNIYLIRHAEAEGNLYRRIHGWYDSLITPRGWKQIEALSKRFKDVHIDAVYSSDLMRTQMTASSIFIPHGLPLHTMPELREVNMGAWEDITWAEVERDTPDQLEYFNFDPEKWSIEGGEELSHLQKRIKSTVLEIASRHEGQTVAAVSHGTAIRALIAEVENVPSREISSIPHCDNTGVTLLHVQGEDIEVEYYGDISHLPEEISTLKRQVWWKNSGGKDKNSLYFRKIETEADRSFYMSCRKEQWHADFPEADMPAEFLERFERNQGQTYTAFYGDKPMGIIELDAAKSAADRDRGYIEFYFVSPEYRGGGLGGQLIGQAISDFRKEKKEYVEISIPYVARENCGFFEHYGFRPCGMAEDGGREMVRMELDISYNWLRHHEVMYV